MDQEFFIKRDISRITGLAPRSVQFYTDEKVVVPDIYVGTKRGDHHKYSERNVFEFALIKELRGYGMDLNTIRAVISDFIHRLDYEVEDFDYAERLRELRPYMLIYKGKNALIIEFKFLSNKKGPVVGIEEVGDHVSIVAVDVYALYERVGLNG